jgi:uncharacterized protein (TIGR02246 family)
MVSACVWLGCAAPEEPAVEETEAPVADVAEDDEALIRSLAESWDPLSNAGDTEGMVNLFAEDAVLLHEDRPVVIGRQAIREVFERQFSEQSVDGSNPVDELQVVGDWAFIRGRFEGSVTPEGGETIEETGKWVSVLHKTEKGWKYFVDIWNRDAEAEATELEISASPVEESAVGDSADVEAIRNVITSWDAALNEENLDSIVSLYSADARRMSRNQPAQVGADAIRAAFEQEFAETNFDEEGPVHGIEVAGDWAHAWGTWSDANANTQGKWLEILRRTPEGWKIYIEIWNEN